MGKLNLAEQEKIAKQTMEKGISILQLKEMGIYIGNLQPKAQANLHGKEARRRMDRTIAKAIDENTEER